VSQRGVLARFLTTVMTVLALFSLAGFQVTTETAGVRLLSRLSAALIEFDRWLPEHRDDLDLLARDRPTGFVRPDLPVPVSLPARSLIDASDDVNRALILNAMGTALYERGLDAFAADSSDNQPPGLSSPTNWAIRLLNQTAHGFWGTILPATLLALLACAGLALRGGRSPLPAVAIGAGIAAVASLAVWLVTNLLSGFSDSATDREIARFLHDGAWIGVRNGVAILAGALALIVFFRYADLIRLPAGSPPERATGGGSSSDFSTRSDLPPY